MAKPKLVTLKVDARALASSRLRRAICAAGLTQAEAGALVGVDARQVRRWLRGEVPMAALEALCAIERRGTRSIPALQPVGGSIPPGVSTGAGCDSGDGERGLVPSQVGRREERSSVSRRRAA